MNSCYFLIILIVHGATLGMQTNVSPPISPKGINFSLKQCLTLEQMALELDTIYHQTKGLILANKVETAYIKAVKCFLEEYEKNNKEALVHVMKMWTLLLQTECEKQQQDLDYKMPSEIRQLADMVKVLWNTQRKARKAFSPRKIPSYTQSPRPQKQEPISKQLYNLRTSLDKLIPMAQAISRSEESAESTANQNFRQGSLLYNQARKALNLEQIHSENKIEDHFANAENTFIDALQFFIAAYNEKYFDAFSEIHKTVKNILDLEQIRETVEDTYAINRDYLALQDPLIQIKEQEKLRRAEKKLII